MGAQYALVLGESEIATGQVVLKNLHTSDQETLSQDAAVARLATLF